MIDYGRFLEAAAVFDYVPRPKAPPGAPVNTGQALISGGPKLGVPVSYAAGVWSANPAAAIVREWVRGDAVSGPWTAVATAVPGTDRPPVSADVTRYLAVRETADNGIGDPVVALSNVLGPVAAADSAPVFTAFPSISGSVEIGVGLSYVAGTLTGSPTPDVVSQWQRSPNGTSSWVTVSAAVVGGQYMKSLADEGRFLSVLETATNGVGPPVTARSNVIGPIEDVAPPDLPVDSENIFPLLNFAAPEWWKNNATATTDTFTETVTATALPHGVEWVDKPRAAKATTYELIFDVQSADITQFSIEIADGSWTRFSAAIYDLPARQTVAGSLSGVGGWTTPVARVSDLGGGVYRIQHRFTTDAASTGINIMLRSAIAGVREYPGNGARTVQITNLWWHDVNAVAEPDQPPAFTESGPFSITASPLTTDLQIFHATSKTPVTFSLVSSPGFEINPSGGGLRATSVLTVGSKPVTVRATNAIGSVDLSGTVVVSNPVLALPVISGGTDVGSMLTATNGDYEIHQLYWERDGRIVCRKSSGYLIGEIDIHSAITVGCYDGMRLIARSAPVNVTQPSGEAWSAREMFTPGQPERAIVSGTTMPTQGATTPYRSVELLKIAANGGLTTTSDDAMTYGITYLDVGTPRQDHIMHVTGVQHATRIELRFCVDSTGGWIGESGGTASGYGVFLDRNWNIANPMASTLRKYAGGGAASTTLATGASIASGTTEITITTTVTPAGIAVAIAQDGGATINLSASDTAYRGAAVSPAILAGGTGNTKFELQAGRYEVTAIPESDRYVMTFEDRFADGDLGRFTDSGAPQTGKQVYRTRYSWDRETDINGEWQRFTAVEDVGNGSTPRGIQPFSFDKNGGSVITARRATPTEIPMFHWNNGGHYATSPGSNRAVEKWLSGVFTGEFGFNQQYGFFEAMVSCTAGHALWLANWLLSTEKAWPPEFDIPEYDGGRPDKYSLSVHANHANGNRNSVGHLWATMPDGTISDKQCFQLRWSPGKAEFFINSVPVWSREGHNIHHRMFWLFCWPVGSNVTDGSWIGQPTADTPSPAKMRIHYVRSYQRRSWHDAPPVVTSRPVLSINSAGVCTITHGVSNAASVVGFMRKSDGGNLPKIAGTDGVTTYTLTDADRRNLAGDYGVSVHYVEFHIGAGDSPESPRRREVSSQTWWLTATGAGETAAPSPDQNFDDFFFDVAAPPEITTNGGSPISVNITSGATAVVSLAATGSPAPSWSLSGVNTALFNIGASSGVVTFKSPAVAGTYVITAAAANGNAPNDSVSITVTVTDPAGPDEPPVAGMTPTLDYLPSRDGLTLLQGTTLAGYQANAVANPGRLWMPRFMDGSESDIAKGTINAQCESFMVDPQYAWSNGWTPFSIDSNGDLRISARRVAGLGFAAGEVPIDPMTGLAYEWVTGMLSTQASWQQHGGYWEVESRGPTGPGNWWSFWGLNGQVFSKRAEIDVVEIVGAMRGPNAYQANAITSDQPANTHEKHVTATDIAGTFHRYGVLFTDTTLQFYLDGTQVGAPVDISAIPKMGEPFSLILTNFVGSNASVGEWVGHPDETTGDPSDLIVRYVKAWQRPGPVSLSLSASTYGEDQPAGATIATLSSTTFSASGVTYSKVADPAGKFTLVGDQLRLATAGGGTFNVTLRATDSASRTFTRQFTIGSMPWIPSGATNVVPSQTISTATELQNVTPTADTITETTADGFHGFNWLSMSRDAGAATIVVLAEVESSTVPMFSVEAFSSTWAQSASAIFDLSGSRVHYSAAAGGWSGVAAHVMPVGVSKWRVRLQFTADASSTGLSVLFRHADSTGNRSYVGSAFRSSKVTTIGAYVPGGAGPHLLSVGQQLNVSGASGAAISGVSGGTWSSAFVRHQYSKVGAWNCNQTRLCVVNRDSTPSLLFLDAFSLQPLNLPAFSGNEFRWHPTDPDLVYLAQDNALYLRNIVTGSQTLIYAATGYVSAAIGPGEGNLSDDGRWLVLGVGPGSWPDPPTACILVDTTAGTGTAIATGFGYVDWGSVSPTGTYIVISGGATIANPDRTRVLNRATGSLVQEWSEYGRPSHYDLTIQGGVEYAVGVSKSSPDDGKIIARRLDTGAVTTLIDATYGWHASARNVANRAAGVLCSFADVEPHSYRNQAVLARFGQAPLIAIPDMGYTGPDDYWNQPQPCISPNGDYVIWAAPNGTGRTSAFVRRIS